MLWVRLEERYWWAVMPRCCFTYLQKKLRLTKIAVLYLRMTMSGLLGTLLTFKRYLYPCDHSHLLTSISGLVALLRICDMQRWRCCGVNTSGIRLKL